MQTLSGTTWTTRTVPWINGPNRSWNDSVYKVFGGDSRGYGSSRADITSLAGQTVRVVFKVLGDQDVAFLAGGWTTFACTRARQRRLRADDHSGRRHGFGQDRLDGPGVRRQQPVASYRITRSDGKVTTLPATARSTLLGSLNSTLPLTVNVAAVNGDGQAGPRRRCASTRPTTATTSVTRVRRALLHGDRQGGQARDHEPHLRHAGGPPASAHDPDRLEQRGDRDDGRGGNEGWSVRQYAADLLPGAREGRDDEVRVASNTRGSDRR